jgi:hypothetical protein
MAPWSPHSHAEQFSDHTLYSFILVVTFYKVTLNTELANTEPSLLGDLRGETLARMGHNTVTNQAVPSLILCMSLFKDTRFN